MSSVFEKLCLRDFLRRRVSAIPPDTADGLDIPISSETTPLVSSPEEEVVWYFAYGSNLSDSTFLKRRNQRPIKTIQAVAPGYVLRFDLPGLPYQEPSFSSIRSRIKESDPDVIGIAYLLTREEYERLLLSEGGRDGGYKELDVPVKPLMDLTNEKSTILCKSLGTRVPREHPHPLPSARYISLIRNGAADHKFPAEYQHYLNELPIYTISSWKTEAGRILFLAIWLPIVLFIFAMLTRKNHLGEVPRWVKRLQTWAFTTMWWMHDSFFSKVFGPGDITPDSKDTMKYNLVEKV